MDEFKEHILVSYRRVERYVSGMASGQGGLASGGHMCVLTIEKLQFPRIYGGGGDSLPRIGKRINSFSFPNRGFVSDVLSFSFFLPFGHSPDQVQKQL